MADDSLDEQVTSLLLEALKPGAGVTLTARQRFAGSFALPSALNGASSRVGLRPLDSFGSLWRLILHQQDEQDVTHAQCCCAALIQCAESSPGTNPLAKCPFLSLALDLTTDPDRAAVWEIEPVNMKQELVDDVVLLLFE